MTVRFDDTTYTVEEYVEILQPLLVLSNPSSFVETVQVTNTDVTANGRVECTVSSLCVTVMLQEVMIISLDSTMLQFLLDTLMLHLILL